MQGTVGSGPCFGEERVAVVGRPASPYSGYGARLGPPSAAGDRAVRPSRPRGGCRHGAGGIRSGAPRARNESPADGVPTAEAVRMDLLRPSVARATVCEFKGVARYLDAVLDGRRVRAAAWSYPD